MDVTSTPGATPSSYVGCSAGSTVSRAATMRTSVPVQWAKSGGMSATEPMSIASARKASSVLGPPVMLAHSTSTSSSSTRPEVSSATWVAGSPTRRTVSSAGASGSAAVSASRGPASAPPQADRASRPTVVSMAVRIRGRARPRRGIADLLVGWVMTVNLPYLN